MSTLTKEIFISYSRHDIEVAKEIKADIEQTTGVECWMDLDCIDCGDKYEDIIVKAIDEAKIVIFFLSEHSMQSEWTKDEVRYALRTDKKVIPVCIDGTQLSGWYKLKLGGIDTVDYADPLHRTKFMRNICKWTDRPVPPGLLGDEDEGETGSKGGGITAPKSRDIQQTAFYTFVGIQTLVFGVILEAVVSMFFFGLLTMPEGQWAFRYNVALAICLGLTMYATWSLFQKKRIAYAFLCVLDILEFVFLCGLARRITVFAQQSHHTFHAYPYTLLDSLGSFIVTYGDVTTVLLLIFTLGTLHIGTLSSVLFIKYPGRSMWSRMK